MALALSGMTGPGEEAPAPPSPVKHTHTTAPSPPNIDSPALRKRLSEAEVALSICQLEQRLLSGRLQAYEGDFQEWPEQVEPRFLPEALQDALGRAIDGSGLATLEAMDCEEFPCVAVVEAADPDQPCCMPIQRLLKDVPGYEDTSRPSISGVIGGRPVLVVAFQPPGELGELLDARTGWRLNEIYTALQAEAGEI